MVSKRIDITLDAVVLKRLDFIKTDSGMSRSGVIAMLVNEKYQRNHKR